MSGAGPAGVQPAGTGGEVIDAKIGVRSSQAILLARRLLALIQPCTGERSSGTIRLQAKPGLTVRVPFGCYGFPVLGKTGTRSGESHPARLFKSAHGPEEDGSWLVTDVGMDVTFISNTGGARHNIPSGSPFILDPPSEALISTPLPVTTSDFEGGTDFSGFGAVMDAVIYESMDGPAVELNARRSQLARFPGVVITWEQTIPADGVTISRTTRDSRLGTRSSLYSHEYVITVIMDRASTDQARRHEGLAIADTIMDLVIDRQAVDGECVSAPSGVQVRTMARESGPQAIYQKFYIYNISVSAQGARQTIDTRAYNEWLLAVLNADKPDADKGAIRVVADNRVDME